MGMGLEGWDGEGEVRSFRLCRLVWYPSVESQSSQVKSELPDAAGSTP
jgi:hypothetical protein